MGNETAVTRTFDTDILMKSLYQNLASDFQLVPRTEEIHVAANLLLQSRASFRDFVWPTRMLAEPYTFKVCYQMESLLKRYKFADDKFTQSDLEETTFQKFVDTQRRIGQHREIPLRAHLVIRAARRRIAKILRNYDENEHIAACKFGTRASVGHPSSRSSLDQKMEGPFTGSKEHIEWFEKIIEYPENYLLKDMVLETQPSGGVNRINYHVCDSLALVNVNKTFKALRSIMPNTLIGGFYTYGLGKVIQSRLVDEGLNIRYLQDRHRHLVRKFSVTRSHVTADLSSASDSFTSWLMARLVPRKWYNVLKLGRIDNFTYKGSTFKMASFMTMGIGFTFQLQTLLFYALLKGIQDCLGRQGFISVYGDDLIYPTGLHKYVNQIFNDIGFILNADKTFCNESFRESCGSDFYHGYDVRPFQPEGQSQSMSRTQYICFIYKLYNGLLRRWDKTEIPRTIKFLESELLYTDGVLLQVPPYFPENSGIRVDCPQYTRHWCKPWRLVCRHWGSSSYHFLYYKMEEKVRPVLSQYVFYWNVLRSKASFVDDYDPYGPDFSKRRVSSREVLLWRREKPKRNRSKTITESLEPTLKAYVAIVLATPVHNHTSVSTWR